MPGQDELEQKIVDLQNQINNLNSLVNKNDFSNTYLQTKNMIQSSGAMTSPNFVSGSSGWSLNSNGDFEGNNGIFRGDLTGNTITGATIQTSTSGARVVIDDGNDITLYDASTGGGGTVTGNSSEIEFRRVYDTSKGFIFRQRAGKNNNAENVLELYGLAPASGYSNYIYIGRQGQYPTTSAETGYIEITGNIITSRSAEVSNGTVGINVGTNGAISTTSQVYATDVRNFGLSSGVAGVINGTGTNGFAGMGYNGTIHFWLDSASTKLDNTLQLLSSAGVKEGELFADPTGGAVTLQATTGNTLILNGPTTYGMVLQYNGSTKAAITSSGITSTGSIIPNSTASQYSLGTIDNKWYFISLSGDAYVDGTVWAGNSYITGTTTAVGKLKIPVGTNLY